ncbi:hypothetical protein Y600_6011 [Burkholderia pseudomallei MSHR3709]|nr:hypothetical protein Y600_6011 [Burkholderia pseudomallei MSHR3709]
MRSSSASSVFDMISIVDTSQLLLVIACINSGLNATLSNKGRWPEGTLPACPLRCYVPTVLQLIPNCWSSEIGRFYFRLVGCSNCSNLFSKL